MTHGFVLSFPSIFPGYLIILIGFFYEMLKSKTYIFPFDVEEQNIVGLYGDHAICKECSF